jgi:hypothetical protein
MKHDFLLYCSNYHAHDEIFSRAGDGKHENQGGSDERGPFGSDV